MIRPVRQIASGAAEMIGTLEQNNMNIRVPDGGEGGSKRLKFTHTGGAGAREGRAQALLAATRGRQGAPASLAASGGCGWMGDVSPEALPHPPTTITTPSPPPPQSSTPAACSAWWPPSRPTPTSTSRPATCTSARWPSRQWARQRRWAQLRPPLRRLRASCAWPPALEHFRHSKHVQAALLPRLLLVGTLLRPAPSAAPSLAHCACRAGPSPSPPACTRPQALTHRTDNKMYRIQTPQTPIARTKRWVNLHARAELRPTTAAQAAAAHARVLACAPGPARCKESPGRPPPRSSCPGPL